MSTSELEGRVALVTGAGRGIGRALAPSFTAMHDSGTLLRPQQSAGALLGHLHAGGSGQIWNVA